MFGCTLGLLIPFGRLLGGTFWMSGCPLFLGGTTLLTFGSWSLGLFNGCLPTMLSLPLGGGFTTLGRLLGTCTLVLGGMTLLTMGLLFPFLPRSGGKF